MLMFFFSVLRFEILHTGISKSKFKFQRINLMLYIQKMYTP